MKCPKCKSELNCGCNSCKKHSPDKINKMILHNDDESEECPVCGFRQHIESWADEEYEQYTQIKEGRK